MDDRGRYQIPMTVHHRHLLPQNWKVVGNEDQEAISGDLLFAFPIQRFS